MEFEYKDGKCIVLKKEMENCLVLPKGTFSLTRDACLSKEGFEKLKEATSKNNVRKGKCCINRQEYDDCYVIPVGLLHPKVPMLLSHAAISGIGSAIAKAPEKKEEPKAAPAAPVEPPAAPVEPKEEEPKAEEPEIKDDAKALEEATLDREIAEENLEAAKTALSEASGGDVAKAQDDFSDAQAKLDNAKEIEERISRRFKADGS